MYPQANRCVHTGGPPQEAPHEPHRAQVTHAPHQVQDQRAGRRMLCTWHCAHACTLTSVDPRTLDSLSMVSCAARVDTHCCLCFGHYAWVAMCAALWSLWYGGLKATFLSDNNVEAWLFGEQVHGQSLGKKESTQRGNRLELIRIQGGADGSEDICRL
eukprot:scaffold130532_cov18-Tisochrysis_lutea.AAC.4